MNDQEHLAVALRAVGDVIAEYYVQRGPRDANATLQRLIGILDTRELATTLRPKNQPEGIDTFSSPVQTSKGKAVNATELAEWLLTTHDKYPDSHLVLAQSILFKFQLVWRA